MRRLRDGWAFAALFSLWDGDGMRDALGWWGFGAVSAALLAGAIMILSTGRGRAWRLLRSWNAVPIGLFVLVCGLSAAWSAYPLVTLVAVVVQLATAITALALLVVGPVRRLVVLAAVVLHVHAALDLLFELVVALSPSGRLLPSFTSYGPDAPDPYYWSQGRLLHGGRIQGIAGNANLTGFTALLALILLLVLLRAGALRGRVAAAGIGLDLAVLYLTRSATVTSAAVVVCATAAAVVAQRRLGRAVLVAGGLAAALAVLVASSPLSGPIVRALGRGDDFSGRLGIWDAVGGLIRTRPLTGWGWTGWWAPWVQPYDRLVVRDGVQYLQAHNAFLDVVLQTGIPGIAAWALVVGSLTWRAARLALEPGPLALLPVLLTAALLTQGVAESRLLIEGNWALLVQLSLVVPAASRTRAAAARAAPRPAAAVRPLAALSGWFAGARATPRPAPPR